VGVRFTERELDIMQVLWDRGEATVAEVQEHLADSLAYNTVLTMLRVLEDKGHVTRSTEGRAHRYRSAVERDEAGRSALGRVTKKLFRGSPEALLLKLVKQPGVTREEVRRMRDLLDRALRDAVGSAADEEDA
jgi:predicted transcriptional regulator